MVRWGKKILRGLLTTVGYIQPAARITVQDLDVRRLITARYMRGEVGLEAIEQVEQELSHRMFMKGMDEMRMDMGAPPIFRNPLEPELLQIRGVPEGLGHGTAQAQSRRLVTGELNPGPDKGFGSVWQKIGKKVGTTLFGKGDDVATQAVRQRREAQVFGKRREEMAQRLAPTEFLRQQQYTIRTPASGNVTVRAGGSEVTFGMVGGELLPEMVTTAPAHRRQGIASYMYRVAEESTGMRISTKATKTEMGAAFVAKRKYKELDLSMLRPSDLVNPQLGGSNQATKNIVMATMKTHAAQPQGTPNRIAKSVRGNRGSRRVPSGGNG